MSFPNLTVNAIGLFVDKGNLFLRITVSMVVIFCSCIFTIIFIFVDTIECKAIWIFYAYNVYRNCSKLRKRGYYIPAGYRTWSVVIQNEYIAFVLIALMSVSHGYYSSVAMMYDPRCVEGVDASKARIIGKMSAFFLVYGIACGIGFSFLAEYPVHW